MISLVNYIKLEMIANTERHFIASYNIFQATLINIIDNFLILSLSTTFRLDTDITNLGYILNLSIYILPSIKIA